MRGRETSSSVEGQGVRHLLVPKWSSVGPHVSVCASLLSLGSDRDDGLRADKQDIWA